MSLLDDLNIKVSEILSKTWNTRDGTVVPTTTSVALAGGAVNVDVAVLYADLAESSILADDFYRTTAAKIIRAFLYCMCRLITEHNGVITSFDGDRVMGIFMGNSKNTNATTCALKMKYVVSEIIKPKVSNFFASVEKNAFDISHGIDTGKILAVKAGQRDSNDLVWVGRPAFLAAKLSSIREDVYNTFISEDVFNVLDKSAKMGGPNNDQLMWEKRSYNYKNEQITVYRSSWHWKP